jgi:ribosomal protein L21E
VDATVDAHLSTWNVNDDLSMKIEPAVYQGMFNDFKPGGGGVRLTLIIR